FAEPRRLLALDGEYIVPVLETQPDPANPAAVTIVTPYFAEGSALDAMTAGHRFSLSEATRVTSDLLNGASRVHLELNCIHGDLKLGQIFLHSGRTRGAVGDLGSAAPMDPSGKAPIVMPTWIYVAPEAAA